MERCQRLTAFSGCLEIAYLVLLVDAAHERGGGRQDLVDEDEDGLFRRELDALADDVDELPNRQVL